MTTSKNKCSVCKTTDNLEEPIEVRGHKVVYCTECLEALTNIMLPVVQAKAKAIATGTKLNMATVKNDMKTIDKAGFKPGDTVAILGGIFGTVGQKGKVLGFKPAEDKGEIRMFVGVQIDSGVVLKYPNNITKVTEKVIE